MLEHKTKTFLKRMKSFHVLNPVINIEMDEHKNHLNRYNDKENSMCIIILCVMTCTCHKVQSDTQIAMDVKENEWHSMNYGRI